MPSAPRVRGGAKCWQSRDSILGTKIEKQCRVMIASVEPMYVSLRAEVTQEEVVNATIEAGSVNKAMGNNSL